MAAEPFAGAEQARRALDEIAEGSRASSGHRGRTWTRDDVYER